MPALKNPKHEAFCREVAGGLTPAQAWVAIGNSAASNNVGRLMARQEIKDRIAELQKEFSKASGISVNYLQEKLLPIATSDVTRYFKRERGGKLKLRDVTTLPPELRAALSELRLEPDGTVTVKLWDKIGANNTLLKTVGGFAPDRLELTDRGGGPIEAADGLAPLDAARRLTWAVYTTLRGLADDPDTQAICARWIRNAADTVLGETDEDRANFDVATALPPMECAREALAAMARCGKLIAGDREAAAFTVDMLREIAAALEHDAAPKLVGASPAGAS